jgi:DNA-binding NarL/FixJ family response regulator
MDKKEKHPRVLLADDHRIFLEGLRSLLEPDFEIVGTVEDGRTLLEEVKKLRPQVIVADISMPLLNGIEAARQIKKIDPHIRIILLTMHPDVTYAARGFEAGASGYVLKHSAPTELVTAIDEALRGKTYITPRIAGELLQFYKQEGTIEQKLADRKLTPRQREVLQLLAEGHSAKEVAAILGISTRTVEFHKYRIMEELNLKTSAELIQYAIKHGIISL